MENEPIIQNQPEQDAQRQPIPWELRKEIGFLKALWRTICQVLFKPDEFFASVNTGYSLLHPLFFCFLLNVTTGAISSLISLKLDSLINKKPFPEPITLLIYFSLLPILVVVSLYAVSGLAHLFIMLFRGKGGFRGTFCIFAYASSCSIFTIVPFLGPLTGGVWAIVVGLSGFRQIHKFKTFRAVLAYFSLPFIITVIAVILVIIFMPQILKKQMSSNEEITQTNLKNISFAIENYRAANDSYPKEEYELLYAKEPYLDQRYDNANISGYTYSLNLSSDEYEVIAKPIMCGTTGSKIFNINTDGFINEEECKKQ